MLKSYIKIIRNFLVLFGKVPFSDWTKFLYLSENQPSNAETTEVTVREIGNKKVFIRKYSRTDRDVFKYVFYNQYHLPHTKLPPDAVILDMGTNIGLTVVHYNYLYPNGQVLGFEMDLANFALAEQNSKGLKGCKIFNNAVWYKKDIVKYNAGVDADAFTINASNSSPNANIVTVEAISIGDILAQNNLKQVDYIKMDIEGAEKEVLTLGNLDWLDKVKSLNVEIHDRDFIDPAIKIFRDKGFECFRDTRHPALISAHKN